jgi:hypothetical protein
MTTKTVTSRKVLMMPQQYKFIVYFIKIGIQLLATESS